MDIGEGFNRKMIPQQAANKENKKMIRLDKKKQGIHRDYNLLQDSTSGRLLTQMYTRGLVAKPRVLQNMEANVRVSQCTNMGVSQQLGAKSPSPLHSFIAISHHLRIQSP